MTSHILDLQRYLAILGLYDARYLDGKTGKMTDTAIHDLLEWHDFSGSDEQIIGLARDKAADVLPVDDWTFASDPRTEFVFALSRCSIKMGMPHSQQIAYQAATAQWETGTNSFIPNQEGDVPGLSKAASDRHRAGLRYAPYWGRGLIHTTWEDAYRMLTVMLKIDVLRNPELLMTPPIALFVMVWSFKTGFPTSGVHPLARHIGNGYCDYKAARKCVNGINKRDQIAEIAEQFENDLNNGVFNRES